MGVDPNAEAEGMHLEFVQPSKRYADVIPQGGDRLAVGLLLTLIRSLV